MKKLILSLILFLQFAFMNTNAQITFQRTYAGGIGYSVQQTTDRGYVVAGTTIINGSEDFYLIKTDSIGDVLWSKSYGGGAFDHAYSVQQTSDKGYIMVGTTNSFGAGNLDVYLVKTDTTGIIQWTKTYGGTDAEEGYAVQQTFDGGYIITGRTRSYGAGNDDVYLIKTDSVGNIVWTKTYGGSSFDYGRFVQETSDSGYVITGSYDSGTENGVYLIKTNSLGDTLWTKAYYISGGIQGTAVRQTSDSGYIVIASGTVFANLFNLIKTNTTGNILWSKSYNIITATGNYFSDVRQTTDGGYIVATGSPDIYLIKTDTMGGVSWVNIFGGNEFDQGHSVQQTTDNGYIVAGFVYNGYVYLIKTDINGISACNQNVIVDEYDLSVQVYSAVISIGSGGAVIIPNTIDSNTNIVINDTCDIINSANIEKLIDKSIQIYPNPFTDKLSIKISAQAHKMEHINLFNLFGEKVYSQKTKLPYSLKLNLDFLPRGIYILKIYANDQFFIRKIIKL